jgi:hypothetical protein
MIKKRGFGAMLQVPVVGGVFALTFFLFVLPSLIFENDVQSDNWDKRRRRWAYGSYDPAYPDDDAQREIAKKIYK